MRIEPSSSSRPTAARAFCAQSPPKADVASFRVGRGLGTGEILGLAGLRLRVRSMHSGREHTVPADQHTGPSQWLLVVVSYEQTPARIVSAFANRKDPKSWSA